MNACDIETINGRRFCHTCQAWSHVGPIPGDCGLHLPAPAPQDQAISDTRERELEVDALLREFQQACEAVVFCSVRTTAARQKERTVLRNALRARLLSSPAPTPEAPQ